MKHTFRLWAVLLLVTSAISTSYAQPPLTEVRIASGGHIVHFLPLDVAQALGFFEEQGLDPKITYLKGGTKTAQALISGQVDFSTNGIDHAFKSAVQGKDDLRMVVLLNQTPGMVLVAHSKYRNSIKSISDLKRKNLGVTSKGSATNMVLAFLLSKNGLNQDDITVIKAGASTFPAALKNGDIDGGIALEPFASMMVEQGDAFVLQRLISMEETTAAFGGPYNLAGILTRQEMIDNNHEIVQKVVNAHIKALRWIGGHTAEEIADILPREVIGSDKGRYINTLKLLKDFYSKNGIVSHEGADNVLSSMLQSGVLSASNRLDAKKYYSNKFTFLNNSDQGATTNGGDDDLKNNPNNGSNQSWWDTIDMTKYWGVFGIFATILIALIFHKKSTKKSDEQYKKIDKQNKELKEQLDNFEKRQEDMSFIDDLDEFVKKVLEGAEVAKTIKLSIPSPLLNSFRYEEFGDADFTCENYKDSNWWKSFAGAFLEKVSRESKKVNITLVLLKEKQHQDYAKNLLNSDDLAIMHSKILKEFIDELRKRCNLKIEYLYKLPYWSVIIDPKSEKKGYAIVCFSAPDMVTKHIKNSGDSPDEIAGNLKGILAKESHAVKYFSDSFDDMQTRHYFYDVVEEIRDQLHDKRKIDMTFVRKWEKIADEADEVGDWEPHEVIVRKKRS